MRIKTCPYCPEGGDPVLFDTYHGMTKTVNSFRSAGPNSHANAAIICMRCGMQGPTAGHEPDKAVSRWNRLPRKKSDRTNN